MLSKIWMVLGVLAITVTMAAATKTLWFPDGLQNRWNKAWITYPSEESTPRVALLSGYAHRMAELENYYREMIEKEKARHIGLLAEKAKLSQSPATP